MYCLFITYNIVIPIISSVTSVNLKKAGMASRRKYIDILIDGECRNKNCLRGRGGNAGIVSKLWHDIRAVFSHVYLQSFLLHDIRAFFVTYTCVLFPSIWPFSYKRAYICAQKSPYICVTNKHLVYGVTERRRIRGTELYRQQKNPSGLEN